MSHLDARAYSQPPAEKTEKAQAAVTNGLDAAASNVGSLDVQQGTAPSPVSNALRGRDHVQAGQARAQFRPAESSAVRPAAATQQDDRRAAHPGIDSDDQNTLRARPEQHHPNLSAALQTHPADPAAHEAATEERVSVGRTTAGKTEIQAVPASAAEILDQAEAAPASRYDLIQHDGVNEPAGVVAEHALGVPAAGGPQAQTAAADHIAGHRDLPEGMRQEVPALSATTFAEDVILVADAIKAPDEETSQLAAVEQPRLSNIIVKLQEPSYGIDSAKEPVEGGGFMDIIGKPFGEDKPPYFYNTFGTVSQLASALKLSQNPAVAGILERGGPSMINELRKLCPLEGMRILDLGSGPDADFALIAKALGATVYTADVNELDKSIKAQLDGHIALNLKSPSAAKKLLEETGGKFDIVTQNLIGHVPGDPLEIRFIEDDTLKNIAEQLLATNGWYFDAPNYAMYQKIAADPVEIEETAKDRTALDRIAANTYPEWSSYATALFERIEEMIGEFDEPIEFGETALDIGGKDSRYAEVIAALGLTDVRVIDPDTEKIQKGINHGYTNSEKAFAGTLEEYVARHKGQQVDSAFIFNVPPEITQSDNFIEALLSIVKPGGIIVCSFIEPEVYEFFINKTYKQGRVETIRHKGKLVAPEDVEEEGGFATITGPNHHIAIFRKANEEYNEQATLKTEAEVYPDEKKLNHNEPHIPYETLIARSPSIGPRVFSHDTFLAFGAHSNNLAAAVSTNDLFVRDLYGVRVGFRPREEMLAGLTSENINDFGQALKEIINDRIVIDIGCGLPDLSQLPLLISQAFGAREYRGVDRRLPQREDLQQLVDNLGISDIPFGYSQDDALHFLSQLPAEQGIVFHLAGIESFTPEDEITQAYISALLTEMQRVTKPGDAIIIGPSTRGFHPEDYGFILKYKANKEGIGGESANQRVYVRGEDAPAEVSKDRNIRPSTATVRDYLQQVIPLEAQSTDWAQNSLYPLTVFPEAPLVRHFEPVDPNAQVKRDRFGNRLIPSPTLAYEDRDGVVTKAAMLVSTEGEDFIKGNPGILHAIENGIQQLSDYITMGANWNFIGGIDLGDDRRLSVFPNGSIGQQSLVFLLEIAGEKYIIKKHQQRNIVSNGITQPYINEMLQAQAMAVDLKDKFEEAGAKMQTYLFASGQMTCVKFVDGTVNLRAEDVVKISTLHAQIKVHIASQTDPLWKNVHADINGMANVRKDHDGELIIVDPSYYKRPTKNLGVK